MKKALGYGIVFAVFGGLPIAYTLGLGNKALLAWAIVGFYFIIPITAYGVEVIVKKLNV